jgi:O-antigen/teichoic acid export membrane protein
MKRLPGLTLILIATAIAGLAGYFITWLVPRVIGFSQYSVYAIFWSFLFLVVSGLSGIQQEVTRATHPVERVDNTSRSRVGIFAFAVAAAVGALVIASAPLWVHQAFPTAGWALVWPLAVGTAFYVLVAAISGSLYGVSGWRYLFWMICADAILRLIGIGVALTLTNNVVVLAWIVAIPFPAVAILLWPWVRRPLVGRTRIDVGTRRLIWNVSRTIVAAGSMGLMVSGFPFLLGLTSSSAPKAELGLLILAVTLTRAPLIVVVMALQSFLVVFFRGKTDAFGASFARVVGLIFGTGAILAIVAGWLGPSVFRLLFPAETAPAGWLLSVLVVSSALVGALCVSGPAVLSLGRHGVYSAGWLIAAVVTIVCIALPTGLVTRCVVALLVGPITGLTIHLALIARASRSKARDAVVGLPASPGE